MKTEKFDQLWDLLGIYWGNNPKASDARVKYAYWLALKGYQYEGCRDNAVEQSHRPIAWPDVKELVRGVEKDDTDDNAADDEPLESWDKPITADEERQMIRLWARLHGIDEPPEMDTAAEYLAWAGEQRAAMREEAYYADG